MPSRSFSQADLDTALIPREADVLFKQETVGLPLAVAAAVLIGAFISVTARRGLSFTARRNTSVAAERDFEVTTERDLSLTAGRKVEVTFRR